MNNNRFLLYRLWRYPWSVSIIVTEENPITSKYYDNQQDNNTITENTNTKEETQEKIISQENSTSESIKLALEVIQENKEQSQIEEKINEVVKKMGYSEVFSEVNDNIAEITIVKKNADKSDASLVIKMILEEIYRFKNGAEKVDGKLVWNDKNLFESIQVEKVRPHKVC